RKLKILASKSPTDSRRMLLNGFTRRRTLHVAPTTSDSPLPPSDDRVAAEGDHQRGEGDGDEGGLAHGRLSDDEVELSERVQGSHGADSPAPTSRRSDRAVIGAHVDHGGPGIVEGHAVRGQGTPVVHQVLAAP